MIWLDLLLACAAFWGHFAACMFAFNRTHAAGWPRRWVKFVALLCFVFGFLTACYYAERFFVRGGFLLDDRSLVAPAFVRWYAWLSLAFSAAIVPLWLVPWLLRRDPPELAREASTFHSLRAPNEPPPVHGLTATLTSHIPGNQIFELEVSRKTLRLPGLPASLDGFTLFHVSDLHFSHEMDRRFHDRVLDVIADLKVDATCLTGDIVEHEPSMAWFADVLDRLPGDFARWFILGNHDLRLRKSEEIRRRMTEKGFHDVARNPAVFDVRGAKFLVAGHEGPWLPPPDESRLDELEASRPDFRLLLTHTPDQTPWARRRGFDLALAGHVHGGQVKLPWLGPIFCPSRYGRRWSEGCFREGPTFLHVSRGVSGVDPLRLNCMPEATVLTLRR